MEPLSNKPDFVSFHGTIRFAYEFKHPLATNDILLRRRWNNDPSLISKKSIKFNSHRCTPFMKTNSLGVASRFLNRKRSRSQQSTRRRILNNTIGVNTKA